MLPCRLPCVVCLSRPAGFFNRNEPLLIYTVFCRSFMNLCWEWLFNEYKEERSPPQPTGNRMEIRVFVLPRRGKKSCRQEQEQHHNPSLSTCCNKVTRVGYWSCH